MQQIITLTTDFGTSDYFAGALKGALLRRSPALQLVDISHDIQPYNIAQAAFVLQNAFPEFPEGSIHLVGVNCVYAPDFRFLAARCAGHFFLAPDNGVLSLLFGQLPEADVVALEILEREHFVVKNVFAEAVQKLAAGLPFEEIGQPAGPLVERINLQPVLMPTRIRGTVIHVDNFDNAVVNIRREVFEKARNERDFSLFFKRHDPITALVENYCDVPVGEPLCLFNSAGLLEISINMGRAATLLGLKLDDVVEVVFG
jgi:S-adenosyl-L-methionine hydrolase (adenosine-forming)